MEKDTTFVWARRLHHARPETMTVKTISFVTAPTGRTTGIPTGKNDQAQDLRPQPQLKSGRTCRAGLRTFHRLVHLRSN